MYFDNTTVLCFSQRFSFLFLTFFISFFTNVFSVLPFLYTSESGLTTAFMPFGQYSGYTAIMVEFFWYRPYALDCHDSTWTVRLVGSFQPHYFSVRDLLDIT